MRVDLSEDGVQRIFDHLEKGMQAPVKETTEQEHQRLVSGHQTFLSDLRSHSTPEAAITFLRKLSDHELLSKKSTCYVLDLMQKQTIPERLRKGLPKNVMLADKTGSSGTLIV